MAQRLLRMVSVGQRAESEVWEPVSPPISRACSGREAGLVAVLSGRALRKRQAVGRDLVGPEVGAQQLPHEVPLFFPLRLEVCRRVSVTRRPTAAGHAAKLSILR